MKYETRININYGNLRSILNWCDSTCQSNWECFIINEAGAEPGTYEFAFESEKDFATFLIWKK